MRRTEEAERARQAQIEISSAKKRRVTSKNRFTLNVKETNVNEGAGEQVVTDPHKSIDANTNNAGEEGNAGDEEQKKLEEIKPRQRAMGGVWIESEDFPHAF